MALFHLIWLAPKVQPWPCGISNNIQIKKCEICTKIEKVKKGAAFCVPKAKYWSLFPRASTVEEAAAKTRCKVREAAVQCRVCRLQSQSYILLILIRSGGSSGLGMETTDKKTASQNSVRWHGQNDGQINPQMKTAKTTPFIELSHCLRVIS